MAEPGVPFEPVVLPCGCRVEGQVIDGVNTLLIATASVDVAHCEYVVFMLRTAADGGIEATIVGAEPPPETPRPRF